MAKIEVSQNSSTLNVLHSVSGVINGSCSLNMVVLDAGALGALMTGLGVTLAGSDLAIHICAVGWLYFVSRELFFSTSVIESISLEQPFNRRL